MDFREFDELVMRARTFRRFKGDVIVPKDVLRELVDLARLSPSSMNMQPLKFIIINETPARDALFSCLGWAKALKDWEGPAEHERPGGYIIILGDRSIMQNFYCNDGIVAQTMKLGAQVRGYGSCMLGSIDRDRLRELFKIGRRYEILLVLALGEPAEVVMIDPLPEDGNFDYWRDDNDIHHVPKRSLDELIVGEYAS